MSSRHLLELLKAHGAPYELEIYWVCTAGHLVFSRRSQYQAHHIGSIASCQGQRIPSKAKGFSHSKATGFRWVRSTSQAAWRAAKDQSCKTCACSTARANLSKPCRVRKSHRWHCCCKRCCNPRKVEPRVSLPRDGRRNRSDRMPMQCEVEERHG